MFPHGAKKLGAFLLFAVLPARAGDVARNCEWAERAFSAGEAEPPASGWLELVHEDGPGDTKVGLCAFGTPLRLGEKTHARGIGVNSRSVLRVTLPRPAARFLAEIGLDRNVDGTPASATMHVRVGGKDAFATPVLRPDGRAIPIEVPLGGATSFELAVEDGGDGRGWDQADWADARVELEDGGELWLDDLARSSSVLPGLPFSFVCGGRASSEFLGRWKREVTEELVSDGDGARDGARDGAPGGRRRVRTLALSDPETGLEVRAVVTIYLEAPGADWTLSFANRGAVDAPIIERVQALDVRVRPGLGALPVLRRLKGSTCAPDDWLPIEEPLPSGKRVEFGAANGRSSAESPFFHLDWGGGEVVTAVGWSGQWRASVERDARGELRVQAGMEHLRLRLRPGESIRSPRILQVYGPGGDPDRATNAFRETLLRYVLPRVRGRVVTPPIAHLSTSFYELNSTTEAHVLEHLESVRGLGFEVFWLDAYWTRGGFPAGMGNYGFPLERVEPRDRFPRGLAPVGRAVRAAGLGFLLWFEPERVHPGTELAREHPDWVVSPAGDGSGLYDLGNPEAREYMTRYLSAAIDAYGLDWLRIDFNIDPLPFWRHRDAQDPERTGVAEIRYVEGLYRMWDDLRRAHPGLAIDNCASGGRRIDLETCSRAIPLWRSDNTCDMSGSRPETILAAAIKNQLMSAGLNRYLPFSTVGQMGSTPYLFRSGFNGGIAFAEDCRPAEYPRGELAEAIAEAKRLRKYWFGDFYVLSDASLDPAAWCVLQHHRPAEGDGVVVAFRRHRSPYASYDCEVRGIDPDAAYEVTEASTYRPGEPVALRGEALRRYRARIDGAPGSLVIEYRKLGR